MMSYCGSLRHSLTCFTVSQRQTSFLYIALTTGLHDEPLGKAAFEAMRATATAAKQEQQEAAQLEQKWAQDQAAAAAAAANRSAHTSIVAAQRPEDSDSDDEGDVNGKGASPAAASPPRTAATAAAAAAAADSSSAAAAGQAVPAADPAAAERAEAEAAEAVVVANEAAATAQRDAKQAEAQRRLAAETPELHTLKRTLHTLAAPVLEAALLSPEARMQLVTQQAATAADAPAAAAVADHATAAATRALAAVRALADERVPSYALPLPALPTVAEGDTPPPNGRNKRLRWSALNDTELDALLLTLHKPLSAASAAAAAQAAAGAGAAAGGGGEQGGAAAAANEAAAAATATMRNIRITALKTLPLWRTLTGERVALSAAPYKVLGHDVGEGLPLPDSAKSMLLVKVPHLQDLYRDLEVRYIT
jgi:hypothetical protein